MGSKRKKVNKSTKKKDSLTDFEIADKNVNILRPREGEKKKKSKGSDDCETTGGLGSKRHCEIRCGGDVDVFYDTGG